MPKKNYNQRVAVVLFSGGQDSTTCLFWALSRFKTVVAVGFNYGQMHAQELIQAQKIAERAGVEYKIFDIRGIFGKSSLTEHSDHNKKSIINKELPASFVAGRNLLFLTIAGSYCAQIGATDIITGVCQTDYSGYPDCRQETILAQQNTLSLGLGIGNIEIHTPLMYLTKAETWKLAKDLNCLDIIINDTLTDYNGSMKLNEWGFGETNNPASILRAKGYYEAKEKGWI
jgi:7-cyano-7-deazaguanine synthase